MMKAIALGIILLGSAVGAFATYYFKTSSFLSNIRLDESKEMIEQKCEDLFTHFFLLFVVFSFLGIAIITVLLTSPAFAIVASFSMWLFLFFVYIVWSFSHNVIASVRFAYSIRKIYIVLFLLEMPAMLLEIYFLTGMIKVIVTG